MVSDVDGDLLVENLGGSAVRVRPTDGSGNVTGQPANSEIATGGDSSGLLALADVDSGGAPDMRILNGRTSNVAMHPNQAGAPLPAKLTVFMASEKNNASFEVERSLDGRTFERVGTLATADNSAPRTYELPAGTTQLYYHLRQVDQDGTFAYPPVRTVALMSAAAGLALFSNPTRSGAAILTGARLRQVAATLPATLP